MGFVGNINYLQPLDLMLGFLGLDIAGDDGYRLGRWPWEWETGIEVSSSAELLHSQIFGLPLKGDADVPQPSVVGGSWGRRLNPLPNAEPPPAPPETETKKE